MARSMQKLLILIFLFPKYMANFYVFLWKFLSRTSPEIMRSGLSSHPTASFKGLRRTCTTTTINFFYKLQEEYKHLQASSSNSSAPNSSSSTSTQPGNGGGMVPPMTSEAEILHEAKMLREHKDRLEGR